jgi:hypothetical protein
MSVTKEVKQYVKDVRLWMVVTIALIILFFIVSFPV